MCVCGDENPGRVTLTIKCPSGTALFIKLFSRPPSFPLKVLRRYILLTRAGAPVLHGELDAPLEDMTDDIAVVQVGGGRRRLWDMNIIGNIIAPCRECIIYLHHALHLSPHTSAPFYSASLPSSLAAAPTTTSPLQCTSGCCGCWSMTWRMVRR